MHDKGDFPHDHPIVMRKRIARMAAVDAMPKELRALVHSYGLNVVRALLDLGVSEPRHIRHVVETVLKRIQPNARHGILVRVHGER